MLSKQTLCRLHKNMTPGTSSARSQIPPALGGDNKGPNTLCSESHVEHIYAMRPASTVAVSEPNTSLLQGLHFLLPICTCIRNSGQRCASKVCGIPCIPSDLWLCKISPSMGDLQQSSLGVLTLSLQVIQRLQAVLMFSLQVHQGVICKHLQ